MYVLTNRELYNNKVQRIHLICIFIVYIQINHNKNKINKRVLVSLNCFTETTVLHTALDKYGSSWILLHRAVGIYILCNTICIRDPTEKPSRLPGEWKDCKIQNEIQPKTMLTSLSLSSLHFTLYVMLNNF